MLREWDENEHIHILLIVVAAVFLYKAIRNLVPGITNKFRPGNRFFILPLIPLLRLIIIIVAAVLIIPLIIIPTRENVLVLLGAAALGIGFVLKDYISCLFAGFILLAERAYKVGDWVQIGDTYGEVVEIGLRIVKLRTAEANETSAFRIVFYGMNRSSMPQAAIRICSVLSIFLYTLIITILIRARRFPMWQAPALICIRIVQ